MFSGYPPPAWIQLYEHNLGPDLRMKKFFM